MANGQPPADGRGGDVGYVVLANGPDDANDARQRDRLRSASFLSAVGKHRKQNIRITMYSTFFGTLVFSIIQWNIFDAYISFLSKSLGMQYVNSSVGFAESIAGLTSLLLAVPVGLIVDNYSRTKTLKFGAVLGLLATAISFYAFAFDKIVPLYANLFLWGVHCEISGSASEAIFADSISTGKRSAFFAQKGILERLSLSLGPAIMLGLFYFSGDDWTLKELHIPLLLGCCFAPIPCILLWFYRDPHPEVSLPQSPALPPPSTVRSQLLAASPMTQREQLTSASPSLTLVPNPDDSPEMLDGIQQTSEDLRFANMPLQERIIPYLVAFSDFVRKVGAGMTIKFFPLFFINDYGFRPVHINLLFCAYPLCMGVACYCLQHVSRQMGRVQAALIFQLLGIVFLVGMCYLQNVWLMVVFFLIRGSFQNAGYPIDKSIIMDYVPSNRRGLWNAIESITSMTWSGSAVVGGMLADFHDYRYTFFITAVIYLAAAVFYTPLLWLVPRSEQEVTTARRQKAVRTKIVPNGPEPFEEHDEDLMTAVTTTPPSGTPTVVFYASEGDASFLLDDNSNDVPLLAKATIGEPLATATNRR